MEAPGSPSAAPEVAPPRHPTFGEAATVWARIGLLSFGGPAGQIALMHRMLVDELRWISEARFLHALNLCMLLPGPEAMQLATYIGWLLHGVRGGVIAGVLFVLPGLVTIVALSIAYAYFQDSGWLASLFFGLKAAVLAIVVEALLRVGRRALRTGTAWAIAAAAFAGLFVFDIPFPVVVLAAGLAGYLGLRVNKTAAPGGGAAPTHAAAVIDDDAGAVHRRSDSLRTAIAWGGVWLLPLVAVVPLFGWSSIFASLWLLFSQLAIVTFGGAYAVLAYVAQIAVHDLGWLQPGEMVDGLALAETTPGPLVLVLTFVGFQAAFRSPGELMPLISGLLGAGITTWATFAPCFLWIFLFAPHVERLRSNARLASGLAAITAAVVGVILNLAVWFALHVLFRSVSTATSGPVRVLLPEWATLDVAALGLSAGAALILVRFGMIPALAVSGLAGLAISLAGLRS
jgi:chromate transporter